MATRLADGTWEIQGTRLTFPVRIGDAAAACALYPVRASRVRLPSPLVPRSVGGWTLAAVAALDYRVNDLGEYREMALGFPVRGGIHLTQLPVTAEFTREAGRELWGLPKWIGEIDTTFDGARAGATLRLREQHLLTLAVRTSLRLPGAYRANVTAWAPPLASPVRAKARGVRLGRGAVLEVGTGHPMAAELRGLGVGTPLVTAIVDHLSFDMGPSGARPATPSGR
jgi:hypothetical protein